MILLYIVIRYIQAEFCMPLVKILRKLIILRNNYIDLFIKYWDLF